MRDCVEFTRYDFFGKDVKDNYILEKKYRYLKKVVKKYKINLELQNSYFDNIICNFSYLVSVPN